MRRGAALTAFSLASLLLCSCSAVPPVPTVSLDGVDPEVRDAVAAAQQQAIAEPANGKASGRLGMVLQANSLNQPALLSYERAIRLDSGEFAWRYFLALLLHQMSQPEKALDTLAGALRIRADYTPALLRRADLFFQLGRFQESAAAYDAVLAQDRTSAEALYGQARVEQALGDMAAAEDLYGRACESYRTFGAAYYGLATVGRTLGHQAESAKNFELAKRFHDDRPPAADPLLKELSDLSTGVAHYLEQADKLTKMGKMEEAAQLDEKMLARDPENITFLLNLLYLSRFLNRLDGQVDSLFARAKRAAPQAELVYDYYGVAMVRQGRYDTAAAALRKAIELQPADAEPYKFLGEISERQNRPAEAIEYYRRALAADPSDREFQLKLWFTLIVHGRSREAIPELVPALQLDDSYSPMRMFLIGEAYRATGEFAKARQYLEQARDRLGYEGPRDVLAQIEQDLKQLPPGR